MHEKMLEIGVVLIRLFLGFIQRLKLSRLGVMKAKDRNQYCPIAGKSEISKAFRRAYVKFLHINMFSEKQSFLYLHSLNHRGTQP